MVFPQDPAYRWHDCNLQTYKIKCDELTTGKINYSPIRTFVYQGYLPSNQSETQITGTMIPAVSMLHPTVGKLTIWAICDSDQTQLGQIEYVFTASGSSYPYIFKVSENTKVSTFAELYVETRLSDRMLYLVINTNGGGGVEYKIKYEGF